ncbi:MAG: ATP-binding protein [Ktedonobacteraceae bacterium]
MQLPQPYLHTSERTFALVDRPHMQPREGLIADTVFGYHTLWAAEVPFIPAHIGNDEKDFDSESTNRLTRVMQRQVRLLYDLAQMRDHLTTFELRLVSRPQSGGLVHVGIAFLGKTFHPDKQMSAQLALNMWDRFSAIFPREVPFSYPLLPVRSYDRNGGEGTWSFKEWIEPIPFEQLTSSRNIVELRKYEDWPQVRDVGGTLHARDYIAHPFVPALDYSAFARLFETLAQQQQVCMVAITLRPQRLTDAEVAILHELAGWYARSERGEVGINNPLVDVLREQLQSDLYESYTRARAERGKKVYDNLVREHRSLFMVRLQVVGGMYFAPDDLIEALGSEIMANAGSAYPSHWERVEPGLDELRWARHNLQWLEFARWGISPLVQQDRRIIRLRALATVAEAAGAFRLPVAPASGNLAGLDVRDEPFTLPHSSLTAGLPAIEIGKLLDRGVPVTAVCTIPVTAFSGITQIFGDGSTTRSHLLKQLLSGLSGADIPWVLIGTGNNDLAQTLHARSVNVDEAAGQFDLDIQPLLPPPGVALAQFVDALLRVLLAVYGLEAASATLLRQALMETYQAAGWHGQEIGHMIRLTDLAEQVEAVARQSYVQSEMAAMLHTRCALPLRDAAATAVQLLALPYASSFSLDRSLVVETGWLGSDLSRSLLRACLWMWYTLALTTTSTTSLTLKGIVGLEEAHTLFGTSATTGMASLISKSTGTMLIDERPDLIETDIASRAMMTALTRTANGAAIERVATLLDASPRQQARMVRLNATEALITLSGAAPVLVSLPECS